MIKAILFDLDGTLLDRDSSLRKFVEDQYNRFIPYLELVPKDDYISRFIELDNHGYVWKDIVYQHLTEEFKINELSWEQLLDDYVDSFQYQCVPFPHLLSMLKQLRNKYKLGIISNGVTEFQLRNIQALGVADFFETILISEKEGVKKPNPEIFHRAMARLGVSPSECIYIGDHPENDMRAAMDVGMKTIWKVDSYFGDCEADYSIRNLGEIPSIVEKICK
ncbi:HAD family hydrolase [Evansella sp. AB-rgal1]|uniref:HAD family hydrolase n=1 Tax=Evansella sp. AB-rgal1 TaxID=3242696 RepID=UPI00359EB464